MAERELDLVVFGATGFTGGLVAKYLAERIPYEAKPVRWAIAGRNRDKLEPIGKELGVPVIVCDAMDPAACQALARRARVVCTTVGPFSRYGSALVAACAEAGTHYCDLTGEVHWMREMIDAHHERAKQTGARIVHACGFDSIPSDLGTWALQQELIARHGRAADRVTAYFGESKGELSGGTLASALAVAEAMDAPEVRRVVRNPYALDPDPSAARPAAPDETSIGFDKALGKYTLPFVMAPGNTRVVRRAHALAGFPWGPDFVYREVMTTPKGPRGLAMAAGITGGIAGFMAALSRPFLRAQVAKRLPPPGSGPDEHARAHGYWVLRLVGEVAGDRLVYLAADRAGDPGYGSTSKMLGEAALCLALDPLTSAGGVQTPSTAMAAPLLERLRSAGLTFCPA